MIFKINPKLTNKTNVPVMLLIAMAVYIFGIFNVVAQDLSNATYIKIGNDWTVVYPLPDDIIAEYDHRLKMDDGEEISLNIYRPKSNGKVPIIMAFTSYSKDMWPQKWVTFTRGTPFRALGADLGSMTVSDEANWEAPDPGFWVPNGYALIIVDAPGTGKSTGKHDPFSKRAHQDLPRPWSGPVSKNGLRVKWVPWAHHIWV